MFRELARGMARETIPALAGKGHKVFMVSIGTPKTGKEFAKKTGFPPGLLFADEDNATYNALGLNQGFAVTYLSPLVRSPRLPAARACFPPSALRARAHNEARPKVPSSRTKMPSSRSSCSQTPVAIASRALRSGVQDLTEVMKDWVPWQPPRGTKQASVQGGTLIFQGNDCVWSYRDKATADHADMREVAEVVEGIVQGSFAQQPR